MSRGAPTMDGCRQSRQRAIAASAVFRREENCVPSCCESRIGTRSGGFPRGKRVAGGTGVSPCAKTLSQYESPTETPCQKRPTGQRPTSLAVLKHFLEAIARDISSPLPLTAFPKLYNRSWKAWLAALTRTLFYLQLHGVTPLDNRATKNTVAPVDDKGGGINATAVRGAVVECAADLCRWAEEQQWLGRLGMIPGWKRRLLDMASIRFDQQYSNLTLETMKSTTYNTRTSHLRP